MAGTFRDKLRDAADKYAGIDPRGKPSLPRTGTDKNSRNSFLAVILITFAIMAVGLTVAFTHDNSTDATATPSVSVTATATE